MLEWNTSLPLPPKSLKNKMPRLQFISDCCSLQFYSQNKISFPVGLNKSDMIAFTIRVQISNLFLRGIVSAACVLTRGYVRAAAPARGPRRDQMCSFIITLHTDSLKHSPYTKSLSVFETVPRTVCPPSPLPIDTIKTESSPDWAVANRLWKIPGGRSI